MAKFKDGRVVPDHYGDAAATSVPPKLTVVPMASLDPLALGATIAEDKRYTPAEKATALRLAKRAVKKRLQGSD